MNIFKKLFGGQKTTEEVKQEKEKDFDMVKYDGVRALRMHQFDLAAKSLEHALQLNAEDLECRDYLSQAYISMGNLQKACIGTMAEGKWIPSAVFSTLLPANIPNPAGSGRPEG